MIVAGAQIVKTKPFHTEQQVVSHIDPVEQIENLLGIKKKVPDYSWLLGQKFTIKDRCNEEPVKYIFSKITVSRRVGEEVFMEFDIQSSNYQRGNIAPYLFVINYNLGKIKTDRKVIMAMREISGVYEQRKRKNSSRED